MALRRLCLAAVLALLAACEQPAPPLTDTQGRTLLLHGVNISEQAKRADGYTSWHKREDYARLRDWGLHSIRLLVFWNAIEPQQGVYDTAYLDRVEERVRWARELGLTVILDMHQDIYSEKYTGDGAPDWACLDDGEDFEPVDPWWMRNLQPAVRKAWNNFWETAWLQDRYTEAFARLAERFVGDSTVLGYDLMNEPFGVYKPSEFEQQLLAAFYHKVGARLVALDPGKIMFYEPLSPLNAGLPSSIGGMQPLPAAYFPHYYHPVVHEGKPYDGNSGPIRWAVDLRRQEAAKWKRPLLFGEIGVIAGVEGATDYIDDLLGLLDARALGWFYWSYDRGSDRGFNLLDLQGHEFPVVDVLVRTYPIRTAGKLERFGTDPQSGVFELVYSSLPGVTGPTEIAVPGRRWPGGFTVESTDPAGHWSWSLDADRQVLSVTADPASPVHTVRLVPVR